MEHVKDRMMAEEKTIPYWELNNRITIQTKGNSQGQYGSLENAWYDVAACWARIRPASAITNVSENFTGEIVQDVSTHEITIRYMEGITADMRVLFGDNRIFDIIGAQNLDEKPNYTVLTCVERNSTT
jgi:SPP1 family predicted phage head-tail adaptor